MVYLLLAIHILVCFLLVVVILLQAGKGGGLASAFGGAGTTEAVFGGRHAATFLTKATTVLGIVFFLTSLTLALIYSYGEAPRSVIQQELQGTPAPVAPAPVTPLEGGQPEQQAPAQP